jgi:TrpR family trp operon transcriptional repressor
MDEVSELAGVLCSIDSPAVMRRFLSELHTPAELEDLVLRWRLMRMLRMGRTQREISHELGISLCKITRGSRILKDRHSVTNKVMRVD